MGATKKSLENQKKVLELMKKAGVNTEYKVSNPENRREEYYIRFANASTYEEKKLIVNEMRHNFGTVPIDFQLELESLKPRMR